MKIKIEELEFNAIIGILDFERTEHQKLILNIEAEYVFSNNSFLDYAAIVELVTTNIIEGEYELIEDALSSLGSLLHENFPEISSLFIEIQKPNIIPNCIVGVSELWIF